MRPVSPAEQRRKIELSSNLRKAAVLCAMALVFLRMTSLQQVVHVPLLQYPFAVVGLLGIIAGGGLYRMGILRKPMLFWTAFYAWVALGIPFSSWPGGSFGLFKSLVLTTIPVLMILTGSVMTWAECRRVAFTMAASCALLVALGRFLAVETNDAGRVALGAEYTTISNSNDLAAILVMTLPFMLFMLIRPASTWLMRLAAFAIVSYGLYLVLRTASRGAFVALGCVMLLVLFRSNTKQRIGIIASGLVLAAVSFAALPHTVIARLFTFSDKAGASESAVVSQELRTAVITEAAKVTLMRPIFGAGANGFSAYVEKADPQLPKEVIWHSVHSAFLRAAAETGIPGLIFYTAAIVWTFRNVGRVYKVARSSLQTKEIADLCHCYLMALCAFTVAVAFLPTQFDSTMPILTLFGGLIVTTGKRELIERGKWVERPRFTPAPAAAPVAAGR